MIDWQSEYFRTRQEIKQLITETKLEISKIESYVEGVMYMVEKNPAYADVAAKDVRRNRYRVENFLHTIDTLENLLERTKV